MRQKALWITIGVATGFIAMTAIAGGIALLTGLDRFPMMWLAGTPFKDYTIPALILSIVVGGSSFLAAVAIFAGRESGPPTSMVAGLLLAGFIVGEVVLLNRVQPTPDWIEVFYLGLGLFVFALAANLWLAGFRQTRRL